MYYFTRWIDLLFHHVVKKKLMTEMNSPSCSASTSTADDCDEQQGTSSERWIFRIHILFLNSLMLFDNFVFIIKKLSTEKNKYKFVLKSFLLVRVGWCTHIRRQYNFCIKERIVLWTSKRIIYIHIVLFRGSFCIVEVFNVVKLALLFQVCHRFKLNSILVGEHQF